MQIELGVVGLILGFVISYLTFMRTRDKDVKSEATESAVIRTKLGNIETGVELIRSDIKLSDHKQEQLTERVIRVEEISKQAHENSKQAHMRIDKIEKGVS